MGKKVKQYKAGDFIFAKVKGYPAWPARVQKPNGKKYFVYFYGTGETANLPPNQIFDYAENKDKFLTKTIKRKDFNDGARQIEHDFANKVPLENVIGVPVDPPQEPMDTSANDSTGDDSALDATAADVADNTADDTTTMQNDTAVEDSDEGALVIDEGKKGRKSGAKVPATPKSAKEPKTPRGNRKKEDSIAKEKEEEGEKKEEEFVSRSGRKIRPKRYIDEQTEENATLPSPASKKRRGASPAAEKEKEKPEKNKKAEPTPAEKTSKHYNAISQAELEDLKEPFQTDDEKDHILIACLPSGQYVGIKLFQHRPMNFKNEVARLAWDRQAAANRIALKLQLEKGHITPQSVITQLEMDLNLTDEEKANLDKEREIDEKKSRVQFLKTEMKLIELDAKIKSCLSLEKADTDLCLKLLDELMELDVKCLMLLKHPTCLETVKRMRAYVGNTPSWELSEADALLFSKQASLIRRQADAAYRKLKDLFSPPEGLSFWEYFSERVVVFKKCTAHLSGDERLEMIHEPLEMTMPTSHTMRAAIDAANEEVAPELDDAPPKKLKTPSKSKKGANSTPSKAFKRQSSRSKPSEAEKEAEKGGDSEETSQEQPEKSAEPKAKDPEVEKGETDEKEPEGPLKDASEPAKDTPEPDKDTPDASEGTETQDKEDGTAETDKAITGEKDQNATDKNADEPQSEKADETTTDKGAEEKEDSGADKKEGDKDRAETEKEDAVEPRAKRARESNKKIDPPPKSPTKRKSRS